MALSKGLRQVQFMLQGWVRHARRRYLALSALIFGGLLLASIVVCPEIPLTARDCPTVLLGSVLRIIAQLLLLCIEPKVLV